jgi:hypothetical protein
VHRRAPHKNTPIGFECFGDEAQSALAPVKAVVVFSSLAPHHTLGNLTDEVRKAYIVQYEPDGAEACRATPMGAGRPDAPR